MKKTILLILSLCASINILSADDIEPRLRSMDCIVPVSSTDAVTKRIHSLLKSRKDTEKMIGRSATYFPVFDKYLKEYSLPSDLKYIPCLETELNNKTVSTAGAKGIWQLMSDVKEEFGLRIDGQVDERYDINRASEAALKDLKRMYKAYNNWEMTLAGYNCGAGRLGEAIKRAKSSDFSKVRKFLPQQTQDYIPKFIAFTYVMKNYREHGLTPQLPTMDVQCLGSTKVYQYLSLYTVANITGMTYEQIKELNLQFGEDFIPESTQGYSIFVPRRVMGALTDYISNPDMQRESNLNFQPIAIDEDLPKLENDANYFRTSYMIGQDETLDSVAELFNIGTYNIMLWNNMSSSQVSKGQELVLYLPRVVLKKV
ncbi:MAG: transglycosylase SLT domain-containing protein [Saprospiraceae bacterium]|nr:transglycosylase SLT domain-containing protein [Saprospiraceae bacterium]